MLIARFATRSIFAGCRTRASARQARSRYASLEGTGRYRSARARLLSSSPARADAAAAAAAGSDRRRCLATLSPAVSRRVQDMTTRHREIMGALNSEGGGGGSVGTGGGAALGEELSSLAPVASASERMGALEEERKSLGELLAEAGEAGDGDMVEDCRSEMARIDGEMERLGGFLVDAVLPKDDDDFGADAVLEVRAGTGGDEACLFASELLATYEKEAKEQGWKFETLSRSDTNLGGIKEAAVSVSASGGGGRFSYGCGDALSSEDVLDRLGPYGFFKFESGVHRVQRVPVNDVRIHTSAASVAVLPAPDESAADRSELLPASELRIETMRASGAGGQHVNTTESAVRITHIPTGTVASIQDERSQHKNKAKALKLVTARVRDKMRADEARERGDARSSLMGGGDRSERIRTYNFPQDRVTDHRCKHSEHGIDKLLGGGGGGLVGTFAPLLRTMHREELLLQMEEEESQKEQTATGKGEKGRKQN